MESRRRFLQANVYRVKADGTVVMAPLRHWFDVGQFLLGNFATFRLAYDLYLCISSSSATVHCSTR